VGVLHGNTKGTWGDVRVGHMRGGETGAREVYNLPGRQHGVLTWFLVLYLGPHVPTHPHMHTTGTNSHATELAP
jgi:hypothetical protein